MQLLFKLKTRQPWLGVFSPEKRKKEEFRKSKAPKLWAKRLVVF
jgi:hypothetical protein